MDLFRTGQGVAQVRGQNAATVGAHCTPGGAEHFDSHRTTIFLLRQRCSHYHTLGVLGSSIPKVSFHPISSSGEAIRLHHIFTRLL